jgi:DeoR family transcriptional regulator, aga operon transcriptional repressor
MVVSEVIMETMWPPQQRAHISDARVRRLARILDVLNTRGEAEVPELARELSISEASLRRDLCLLEEQDLVRRTHGGAMSRPLSQELPVRFRDGQQREAKLRIARACVEEIPRRSMAVAISGGTTTSEVARQLGNRTELTIVTNAVNIAAELAPCPRLRVIVAGGLMRSESFEAVGAWTERFIEGLNFGVTIMGVDGISAEGGLMTHDAVEARTNQSMIKRSERTIVVADATKIGRVVMSQIVPVSASLTLVTELSAPAGEIAALRKAGVEVRQV